MNQIGVISYFLIICLSHMAFGIFSVEHRFKKPIVYFSYLLFGVFFMVICSLKIPYSAMFGILFVVYLLIYLILSEGNIWQNLFALTSYLTFIIILFGVSFAYTFIECPGKYAIRWILLIATIGGVEALLYLYLIPSFKRARLNVSKGWGTLLIGDYLFLIIVFMQIFWPFQLKPDDPWTIILFLFCSFFYFFVFTVIISSLSTAVSYNDELKKNDELEHLAHTDILTSLFNKTYFELKGKELVKANNNGEIIKTAIIVMDINKFKSINDEFGHLKGDEILQKVGYKIKEVFSSSQFICFRVGGDEFSVISKDIEGAILDQKISFLKTKLLEDLNVSIAIGYSFVNYNNVDAIANAFKNADKLMYKEKLR